MSYSYSASFLALASSQWIGVPALMTAISEMARLDFSKTSDRRGARTMWNTATSQDQPVSLTKRFPENAAFVCLNDSDWANKRMQLEQALDYTEPTNQQNAAPANPNQPAVQQHNAQQTANNRSSFNDANSAFRNALRTMQDQVRTLDGVWDRGRFEGRFTWYDISRVDLNWQTVVQRVREILPITGVRVHAQAPSGDAWTAYADYIMLAQTLTTPPPLPQDGDFLYLWSHPRANGARTRLQLLRTGGNLTPLSWGPVAVAD